MTRDDYESITRALTEQGWQRVTFDGGQNHTMGWTVMAVWQLDGAEITLNHHEVYNQVSYDFAANPAGVAWLKANNWGHLFEA